MVLRATTEAQVATSRAPEMLLRKPALVQRALREPWLCSPRIRPSSLRDLLDQILGHLTQLVNSVFFQHCLLLQWSTKISLIQYKMQCEIHCGSTFCQNRIYRIYNPFKTFLRPQKGQVHHVNVEKNIYICLIEPLCLSLCITWAIKQ